jgi:hypothetical protein
MAAFYPLIVAAAVTGTPLLRPYPRIPVQRDRVPLCAELPGGVIGTGWTVKISNMTLTARADRLRLPGLREPCAITGQETLRVEHFTAGSSAVATCRCVCKARRAHQQPVPRLSEEPGRSGH